MKKHLLPILALAFSASAWSDTYNADEGDKRVGDFSIYPHLGVADGTDFKTESLYGLGVGYRFHAPYSVEVTYQTAEFEVSEGVPDQVDTDLLQVDGLYHFPTRRSWKPFASLGILRAIYDGTNRDDAETRMTAGMGVYWKMNENTGWRGGVKLVAGEYSDEMSTQFTLGLYHVFGAGLVDQKSVVRDRDGDGVRDIRDMCPGTPSGTDVNERGCPVLITGRGPLATDTNVEFDFDSAELRDEDEPRVKRVADFLKKHPGTDVTLEGHTDNVGSSEYNQGLSERRAKAVADRLTEKFKVDEDRVSSVGYGETRPIDTNATRAGRQNNRRVTAEIETRSGNNKSDSKSGNSDGNNKPGNSDGNKESGK